MKPKAIICDIDGTLSNHLHRLHFVDPAYNKDVYKADDGRWLYLDDVMFPKSRVPWKKDWPAFFAAMDKDTPNEWCEEILRGMRYSLGEWEAHHSEIIFITGRPEMYREVTKSFIDRIGKFLWGSPLYMKPDANCKGGDGEWLGGPQFKKETYLKEIKGKYDVLFALDDDEMCCRMWKEQGVTCLQVKQKEVS